MAQFLAQREFPAREPRVMVELPATVQVTTDYCVRACVVDLSATGFRLVCEEALQTGQIVELQTGKDVEQGTIKWVRGDEAGGVFMGRVRLIAH